MYKNNNQYLYNNKYQYIKLHRIKRIIYCVGIQYDKMIAIY